MRSMTMLRAVSLVVAAALLAGIAPAHGNGTEATPEDLRAEADRLESDLPSIEGKAARLETRASGLTSAAETKRQLSASRLAKAERLEAKAEKRPGPQPGWLAKAHWLRNNANNLEFAADNLVRRADRFSSKAAALRARAAEIKAQVADLRAQADQIESQTQ